MVILLFAQVQDEHVLFVIECNGDLEGTSDITHTVLVTVAAELGEVTEVRVASLEHLPDKTPERTRKVKGV